MLIELLKNDATLTRYFCQDCQENGIGIDISDQIDSNDLLIIKIDNYYNHLVERPDHSPDCLIILRCDTNTYNIVIVELRNVGSPKGIKNTDIVSKFTTCLGDFMSEKFGNYFHNAMFKYNRIDLLLVSDPYGFRNNPEKQLYMKGHKLDLLMATRIPKFFNKHLYVQHKIPNPILNGC